MCIFVYYVNSILDLKGVYLAYKLRKGLHGSKREKDMTRAEAKAKELGVTIEEVYEFIKNHYEAKKDCNDLLNSGMDFDEASVLAYMNWN